ncbi:hypothetical protein ZIOFF_053866 [Zingiber officinale]|uniref:Longin domain-containing protein n=1 Tax=Zingiber officinale TaxID=94328 RepID=A0A8J5KNY2_ZINOF|nr:hypothetical protein ZIOFF_053866 [Zingiber officinale]
MAILYAVVARQTLVLAEFSAVSGNVGAIARRILENLAQDSGSRLCFSQDRYIFHVLRSDGINFLCMANETFGSVSEPPALVSHFAIHTIMVDNIDKILDRSDRLALLVDKTATIAVLTLSIILLLYIIVAARCGGITLPSCRSR